MKNAKTALIICIILGLIISPAFSASKKKKNGKKNGSTQSVKFRDVPDSHWASKAVYKMVKLGVTSGYPDGTFRGKKYITRFETAGFLANLADSLGSAGIEKLGAELKSDIKSMKDELFEKNRLSTSGRFEANYYIGNIFSTAGSAPGSKAPQGPVFNYRLQAAASTNFEDENGSLKVALDTMDGGFYGGSENLFTKLIDIEAVMKLNGTLPLTLIATIGPGPQQHLFGGNIAPSEYGRTYIRPYSGIKLLSTISPADISLSYYAHNVKTVDPSTPGEIGANQIRCQVSWPYDMVFVLGKGSVALTGDYFSQNTNTSTAGATNGKASVFIASEPVKNIKLSGEIKTGSIKSVSSSSLAVLGAVKFDKYFNEGNNLDIKVTAAGGSYIVEPVVLDEWSLLGYDPFDRPRANGARAIQAEFSQVVSETLTLVGRGTLNLSTEYKFGAGDAGSRMTVESGLNIALGKQSNMTMAYRIDKDPNAADTTTDLFILSLAANF